MDIFTEVIKTENNPHFPMPINMVEEDNERELIYRYYHNDELVAVLTTIKGCGVKWDIKSDEYHSTLIDHYNSDEWCQKYPEYQVENPYK